MILIDTTGNKYELVEYTVEEVDEYDYHSITYTGLYMLKPFKERE